MLLFSSANGNIDTKTDAVTVDCNIAKLCPNKRWSAHDPYVLPDVAQPAFYIDSLCAKKYMQKVQHWQFWDAVERNENEEDSEMADLKYCNFRWTDHVDDIQNPTLVSESGEAEVINANVVPDLHNEDEGDVGDQGEKFDDQFIYGYDSCTDSDSDFC